MPPHTARYHQAWLLGTGKYLCHPHPNTIDHYWVLVCKQAPKQCWRWMIYGFRDQIKEAVKIHRMPVSTTYTSVYYQGHWHIPKMLTIILHHYHYYCVQNQTCLHVPECTGHVPTASHNLLVIQKPTAGEVTAKQQFQSYNKNPGKW